LGKRKLGSDLTIERVERVSAFPTPLQISVLQSDVTAIANFVEGSRRLLVLTGAGCSTESGIPDYRNEVGDWKRTPPVQFREFISSEHTRRRYWARSMVGWNQVANAQPNPAHRALAGMERTGRIHHLITQNVDGLHQMAGSRKVIDLHGRLDTVLCLECAGRSRREHFQEELMELNPDWAPIVARYAPDGDADLGREDFSAFRVPDCRRCGGVLKPHVVFFGENVPKNLVDESMARLKEADALLVVGSSLMIWSGYRFARAAAERSIPMAAVNLGKTRADSAFQLKVSARCGEVLPRVMEELTAIV
jgi:NAD-dependent SIR2 family protein deacetylase